MVGGVFDECIGGGENPRFENLSCEVEAAEVRTLVIDYAVWVRL